MNEIDSDLAIIAWAAQSTDGDLYVLAGGTVWQIGLTLEGYAEGEMLVPGAGGGEIYVFDAQGRHLRTLHGLTGATLLTFGYDETGRLITLTDADGLVTTVTRDETGAATGIVGPFGQTTVLEMDENGYLKSLTNPADETYRFQYLAGLMTRLEDPRFEAEGHAPSEAKTYQFDNRGRLVEAHDALDGFTTLRRQGEVGQPNYEVRHRTAEVVTTRHRKWRLRTGEMVKERREPDQTVTETRTYRNGVSITTLPDGSKVTQARRPDPRFGLMAGFGGVGRLERPGGQIGESSSTRAVSLSDPDDPFSIDGLTHTSTIEGRTSTLTYAGATRRFASSSPEGRSATLDIDERGRVIGAAAPQVEPITIDYEPTGEVDKVKLGDDPKTRRITDYAYDALRRLDAVTDAEGFTVSYDYL